jgi:hypothetical protein
MAPGRAVLELVTGGSATPMNQEPHMSSALLMVSRLRNRSTAGRADATSRIPNLAAVLATFPSLPR